MEVLQIPSELERAVTVRDRVKPDRILEIGCWDGGTLREWLAGDPAPSVVVAVSLEHRQPDAYPGWTQPGTQLVVGTGRSQDPDMLTLMQKHAPYDWAFIDGDHGDEAVDTDVANVMAMMRKGGVMLLHDVTPADYQETCGPQKTFRRLAAGGYRTELFDVPERFPWTAGIGVVYL